MNLRGGDPAKTRHLGVFWDKTHAGNEAWGEVKRRPWGAVPGAQTLHWDESWEFKLSAKPVTHANLLELCEPR